MPVLVRDGFSPHTSEHRIPGQECLRRVQLDKYTMIEYRNPIEVDNSVQTMGYCKDSPAFELSTNDSLHELVCCLVNATINVLA